MIDHTFIAKTLVLLLIIQAGLIYYLKFFTGVGGSLFAFSIVSIPILLLLLLSRKEIFSGWWKFALAWVLLSGFVIALTPEYGGEGGFGLDLSFHRELVGQLTAAGFFIVSLLIIAWKSFQLRGKS